MIAPSLENNMNDSDKEVILQEIIIQSNGLKDILTAKDISSLLPQYSEDEIIALLNQEEFYEELVRSVQNGRTKIWETSGSQRFRKNKAI